MSQILYRESMSVKDLGAKGNGVADDTAPIQAAIDLARASLDGLILFPFGTYKYTTLDLEGTTSITFRGPNHRMSGAGATLESDEVGDGVLINARGVGNFQIENMALKYSSDQFTGTVLDLGGGSSRSGMSHSRISSTAPPDVRSAVGVSLSGTHTIRFEAVMFDGVRVGVQGLDGTFQDWSNGVGFDGCFFDHASDVSVRNAGTAWSFRSCVFEPDAAGRPNALAGVANAGRSVSFRDCWFGDDLVSGDWLDWFGVGLVVEGCHLSVEHPEASVVKLRGRDSGLVVSGNTVRGDGSLIDARDGTESVGVTVLGNMLDVASSSTVWRDDATPDVALWQDKEGVTHIENNV